MNAMRKGTINLQTIQDLYSGMVLLGMTVIPDLAEGIEIARATLDRMLTAAGFGAAMPKKPPTDKRAIRRAIRDWLAWRAGPNAEGLKGRPFDADALIRVVTDKDMEYVVYALVEESSDVEQLRLRYATRLRFFLHKKTRKLIATTRASGTAKEIEEARAEAAAIQDELEPFWERHRSTYLTRDLGAIIISILRSLDGTLLSRKGGVYFVPSAHEAKLERLKQLVESLPALEADLSMLTLIPVPDTDAVRAQMAVAAEAALTGEVEVLEVRLRDFISKTQMPSSDALAERLALYESFRRKLALYEGMMGTRGERASARLGEMEAEVRRLLETAQPNPRRARRAEAEVSDEETQISMEVLLQSDLNRPRQRRAG